MTAAKRLRVVKPPEVRTEDLLVAAAQVFTERGFDATTVAEITELAGVAKGNLYRYFSSKEHILGALKARFYADLISRVDATAKRLGIDDWPALIDGFVDTIIDCFYEQADLVRVLARHATTAESRAMFDCERSLTRLIATGIGAGIDAGAFSAGQPELTAALLQHGVIGAVEYALIYQEPVERSELLASAHELVRKALAN